MMGMAVNEKSRTRRLEVDRVCLAEVDFGLAQVHAASLRKSILGMTFRTAAHAGRSAYDAPQTKNPAEAGSMGERNPRNRRYSERNQNLQLRHTGRALDYCL